ncbi:uncharacterized protein DC041_0007919 [Schistosoma bovis]|uniref:Uncharacterized protein n=1 Tax=Schistosoma bovis TaxID=6184 RepID=A0A430Q6Y5_SCHBO|nr:uncharacterized protein DC041_0007919 [Schistosoma bovis]
MYWKRVFMIKNKQMIDAIRILKSGDSDDLQNLLQTFNIHSRDADNNTLLHHACLLGNVKAVRLLLDSGVHANASNIDGQTPICDAALSGSAEIISLLLRSKVDVNPPSYWGSPLIYATQNESINAMKVLIDAGASLNSPERNGLCADPNCGVRLTTPLHMAAKLNDVDITYLLLEFGASPTSLDKENRTPIDYVPNTSPVYQLLKSVQTLILNPFTFNVLCRIKNKQMIDAIRILKSGDSDDLQNLLQTFNIHSRDADNNTLLHHACLLGNVKAVRLLLDSGVHANASNIDGQTPICDAALSGSAEIISLLLRSKVDVNPPSYWGSPLIYATQNESINAMKVLIDAGASLNSPERNGLCADPNCGVRLTTPLHMAAKLNDVDITYLLLEFGASPTSLDKENRTPIDYVPNTSPVYQLLKSVQSELVGNLQ